MRKLRKPLVAVVLFCAAFLATASLAQVNLYGSPQATLSCTAGGGSAVTVPAGNYVMTVMVGDSYLCRDDTAATCASGGSGFPNGTVMQVSVPGTSKSYACRGATTQIQFTRTN